MKIDCPLCKLYSKINKSYNSGNLIGKLEYRYINKISETRMISKQVSSVTLLK